MIKWNSTKTKSYFVVAGLSLSTFVLMLGFQNCSPKHLNSSKASQAPSQAELIAGFEAAAKAVMSENCASCHSPDSSATSELTNIMDTGYLIQEGFLIPGEPQNSPLYLIALDALFPHDENPLDTTEVEALRDWIVALGDPNGTGGLILPPGSGPPDGGSAPTFSFINVAILQPNCVACHRAGNASAGIRLDTYADVRGQVNFDMNDPSRAATSPLYQEIRNGSMPPGPTTLPGAQAQFILEWIEAGAANN